MAERRMMSKKITDTDAFLEMPLSTQALYFHFIQNADDDGFVGSPNSIIRKIGANRNDYDLLIAKKFVITFETGICVIKHWRIHNYIQSDRYTPTTYLQEKSMLLVEENKAYSDTKCIQVGYNMDTQYSIDKNRIEKNSINDVALTREEESKQPSHDSAKIKEIIAYLNDKLGTRYSTNSKKSTTHISARFNEGYKVEDFKLVIDQKYKDWFNTEYAEYLRPETLFGTKFESYLNKAIMNKPKQENKAKVEQNGVIRL